jgi:hypothetical protein
MENRRYGPDFKEPETLRGTVAHGEGAEDLLALGTDVYIAPIISSFNTSHVKIFISTKLTL